MNEMGLLKRIIELENQVRYLLTLERANIRGLGDLADPGKDKILFWDESEGALGWLEARTNLTITGTDLDAA